MFFFFLGICLRVAVLCKPSVIVAVDVVSAKLL